MFRSLIFALIFFQIGFSEFGGGYSGAGYRYASNARELSLGGAMVAEPNWGFHQFGNPALTIYTSGKEAGLSLMTMSLDRSIQVGVVNLNLPPGAAVGIAFFRAGTDNIQGRNLMGAPIESFSASDKSAMITFSRALSNHFSAGFNLKTVFNSLPGGLDAKGIAFDMGMIYAFSDAVKIGGKVENITGRTTWKFDSGATETEDLLTVVSLGASTALNPIHLKIMLQSDTYLIPDHGQETKLKLGAEYQLNPIVSLRGGLNNNKATVGFGLKIQTKSGVHFNVDYALDPGIENEGVSHVYSLWVKI